MLNLALISALLDGASDSKEETEDKAVKTEQLWEIIIVRGVRGNSRDHRK